MNSPHFKMFPHLGVVLLVGLTTTGCGSRGIAPASAATAQSAYDQGIQAFEQGNHVEAVARFTTALETSGLSPDIMVDALLKRAQSRAQQGDFEGAFADLERAEPGAPDLDQVHLARGVVYKAQGNQQGANVEFQKARAINPRIKIP